MKVSIFGTNRILDTLKENNVKATFFCTGNFAENAPEVIKRIIEEGHEVACHGVDHWRPNANDVFRSKEIVERVSGVKTKGYRQPRMFPALLYSAIDYALFRKTDWRSVLTSTALLLLCGGWTLSFALITPRVS